MKKFRVIWDGREVFVHGNSIYEAVINDALCCPDIVDELDWQEVKEEKRKDLCIWCSVSGGPLQSCARCSR